MLEPKIAMDGIDALAWLALIAVAGFLVSWVLTDLFHVGRALYVGVLAVVAAGLDGRIPDVERPGCLVLDARLGLGAARRAGDGRDLGPWGEPPADAGARASPRRGRRRRLGGIGVRGGGGALAVRAARGRRLAGLRGVERHRRLARRRGRRPGARRERARDRRAPPWLPRVPEPEDRPGPVRLPRPQPRDTCSRAARSRRSAVTSCCTSRCCAGARAPPHHEVARTTNAPVM